MKPFLIYSLGIMVGVVIGWVICRRKYPGGNKKAGVEIVIGPVSEQHETKTKNKKKGKGK